MSVINPLIVCKVCHKKEKHYAHGWCKRCYHNTPERKAAKQAYNRAYHRRLDNATIQMYALNLKIKRCQDDK